MKKSIKKNSDFKKVYDRKKVCADDKLILFIDKNEEMDSNRLGISVSKKVGNSVVRHTLARKLREIFRLNEDKMEKPYDIVCVCKEKAKDVDYQSLEKSFIKLCRKQGILRIEDNDK